MVNILNIKWKCSKEQSFVQYAFGVLIWMCYVSVCVLCVTLQSLLLISSIVQGSTFQ